MKFSLIWICIGLIIFAIAWYNMSPVFILMGILLIIVYVIILIIQKITKKEDDEVSLGCGCAVILAIGACSFFFSSGKEYYVSGWGDKRHLFGECEYRVNNNRDYKVGKFGAIVMGCLSDCEACQQKKKEEIKKKREKEARRIAELELQRQQSDFGIIKKKIEVLLDVLSKIQDGEDVDVTDYDFRKDIEDEIREEVMEEMEDARWDALGM